VSRDLYLRDLIVEINTLFEGAFLVEKESKLGDAVPIVALKSGDILFGEVQLSVHGKKVRHQVREYEEKM
jgi:hypothetical protein